MRKAHLPASGLAIRVDRNQPKVIAKGLAWTSLQTERAGGGRHQTGGFDLLVFISVAGRATRRS
jgi:hypothetical protein